MSSDHRIFGVDTVKQTIFKYAVRNRYQSSTFCKSLSVPTLDTDAISSRGTSPAMKLQPQKRQYFDMTNISHHVERRAFIQKQC